MRVPTIVPLGLIIIVLGFAVVLKADPNATSFSSWFDLSEVTSVTAGGDCNLSDKFPEKVTRWSGLICDQQGKIDPNLLAALIWQESGGNPQAYSRDGAVGLMQVMPRDGKAAAFMCPNGPCFSKRPTTEQLNDPEFNIQYGTKMLAGLERRLGNMRDALKAYGPANVGYSYADKVLAIYRQYK